MSDENEESFSEWEADLDAVKPEVLQSGITRDDLDAATILAEALAKGALLVFAECYRRQQQTAVIVLPMPEETMTKNTRICMDAVLQSLAKTLEDTEKVRLKGSHTTLEAACKRLGIPYRFDGGK